MPLEWMPWSEAAFAAARTRGVPIVLLLEASWSRWCKRFEREVLTNPRVEALLQRGFVAVRVDKDRRPDVDAQYSRGGWPTLAYLDERAQLLAADLYLDAEALTRRLELVSGYWQDKRELLRRRLAEAESAEAGRAGDRSGELAPAIVDWTVEQLLVHSDPQYGGWGSDHKFPHCEALELMLLRWSECGDDALRRLVLRTLRHVQKGEIHDRVEGGFYRFAARRDWSSPHYEKVLDSNAQRLRCFVQAFQAFGEDSFADTAHESARWLENVLRDPDTGAFRGSQDADEEYAHLGTLDERLARTAPAVDPTIFANWNACAAGALFEAGSVLQQPHYPELATAALRFVLEEMRDARSGVFHYWDGTLHLPGLLTDHAQLLLACLEAYQHQGDPDWLEHALEVARVMERTLASPEGGYFDTLHDPAGRAGARRRSRSMLDNALAAEGLWRLAHVARDDEWGEFARKALRSFAGDFKRHGESVAAYARSVDLLLRPPVHVTIVGERAHPLTLALRHSALAPYVAGRIVQLLDPSESPGLLERSGFPRPSAAGSSPRAFLERGRESFADTDDPARLVALMTRVE